SSNSIHNWPWERSGRPFWRVERLPRGPEGRSTPAISRGRAKSAAPCSLVWSMHQDAAARKTARVAARDAFRNGNTELLIVSDPRSEELTGNRVLECHRCLLEDGNSTIRARKGQGHQFGTIEFVVVREIGFVVRCAQ